MPKYFPGVTHCLVKTPKDAEEMKATADVIADVGLCFGNDSDGLGPIRIKKMPGLTRGVVASAPKTLVMHEGKKIWMHTLSGRIAEEAKVLALIAFDKVKQKYGLKFNKNYRVFAETIEEIGVTDAKCSPGVGQQPTS